MQFGDFVCWRIGCSLFERELASSEAVGILAIATGHQHTARAVGIGGVPSFTKQQQNCCRVVSANVRMSGQKE